MENAKQSWKYFSVGAGSYCAFILIVYVINYYISNFWCSRNGEECELLEYKFGLIMALITISVGHFTAWLLSKSSNSLVLKILPSFPYIFGFAPFMFFSTREKQYSYHPAHMIFTLAQLFASFLLGINPKIQGYILIIMNSLYLILNTVMYGVLDITVYEIILCASFLTYFCNRKIE